MGNGMSTCWCDADETGRMMPTPRVPKTHASSFNEADAFSNGQAAKPGRKVHSRASIRWSDAGTAEPSAAGSQGADWSDPQTAYHDIYRRRGKEEDAAEHSQPAVLPAMQSSTFIEKSGDRPSPQRMWRGEEKGRVNMSSDHPTPQHMSPQDGEAEGGSKFIDVVENILGVDLDGDGSVGDGKGVFGGNGIVNGLQSVFGGSESASKNPAADLEAENIQKMRDHINRLRDKQLNVVKMYDLANFVHNGQKHGHVALPQSQLEEWNQTNQKIDELRYQLSEAEKNFAKRWRPPGNAKWGEEGAKVVTLMQDCTESLHVRPVPVSLRPASTKW